MRGKIWSKGDRKPVENSTVESQLDALLGGAGKQKKKKNKWLLPIIGGAVLLCGLGAFILVRTLSKTASSEVAYREYTVERGDIIVGDTESSSVSLNREVIQFPVSSTVEEVYVKAGSYVDEGDPIMKLNSEEIETGLASYELELEQAGLKLEQAKLDQTTGLLTAKQKYETAVLGGDLADTNEDISLAEVKQNLASAENSLAEAQENYDEYMSNYYYDYLELLTLSKNNNAYNKVLTDAKSALSSYISKLEVDVDYPYIYTTLDALALYIADLQSKFDNFTALGETTSAEAVNLEHTYFLNAHYDLTNLESAVKSAQSDYDTSSNSYQTVADSFEKTYGSLTYNPDYNTTITNLELQVEKAQLALTKAQVSAKTGTVSAEQQSESAQTQSDAAETEFELTKTELQQKVDAAQEAYDALENEIEDIKEYITDDGCIYASCAGMVASVSLDAGDSFEVYYDENTEQIMEQTLAILTNIADVYVPITISEEDILDISIGQTASVTMTAFDGLTFDAEVDTITVESSRSGAATVSYTVNVRFAGTNTQRMMEGMSAEVTLVQWQVLDVLYVNASCVSNTGGRATVLVMGEDGEPVEREVRTGFTDGRYVEIIDGLTEGETVLMESTVQQA